MYVSDILDAWRQKMIYMRWINEKKSSSRFSFMVFDFGMRRAPENL